MICVQLRFVSGAASLGGANGSTERAGGGEPTTEEDVGRGCAGGTAKKWKAIVPTGDGAISGSGARRQHRLRTAGNKKGSAGYLFCCVLWRPHRESNPDLILRRNLFYPLNYRDTRLADYYSIGAKP